MAYDIIYSISVYNLIYQYHCYIIRILEYILMIYYITFFILIYKENIINLYVEILRYNTKINYDI